MAQATERAQTSRVELSVYGLRIRLEGWAEALEAARLDFAWFERRGRSGDADFRVTVECKEPDFDGFGDIGASFITPRNVVYQDGRRKIVDYFGRAVAVLDPENHHVLLQGNDLSITHDALYQCLVSRV